MEPQIPQEHPLAALFSNLLIYCSQYPFPQTQQLLRKFIHHPGLVKQNFDILKGTLEIFMDNFVRETIYGPSGCYVPVGDRPHKEYLDLGCIYEEKSEKTDYRQILAYVKQNNLTEIIKQNQVQQLSWYNRDTFFQQTKFIHKKITKNILKQLQMDGECWNTSAAFPTLLLTLNLAIKQIVDALENQHGHKIPACFKDIYLLRGRLCFIHNKILKMPAKSLYEKVVSSYRKYLSMIKQQVQKKQSKRQISINSYISILLEYMHALTFYYKYKEAEVILELCKNLANISLEYTGKLGRRTKYQSFDTAQLVMNFKQAAKDKIQKEQQMQKDEQDNIEDDLVDIPSAFQLVSQHLKTEKSTTDKQLIEYSQFDQQSILLEKLLLVEQQSKEKGIEVTEIKLLVSLCALQYTYKTTPKDQVLYQQISTALTEMLAHGKQASYPLLFNMLFLRSENQFDRVKNAERAIQQFQSLKNNYNQKPKHEKNSEYTLSTDYKVYLEFISHLADRYLGLGMVMTAVELYEQVGMYEECIDGLVARNYRDKAKEKIYQILARDTNEEIYEYSKIKKDNPHKTPRLLCMLGDIYKLSEKQLSLALYNEAWELSHEKFARAQRSIGWHYYGLKDFEKAAIAFKKATSVNYYNPNTWFTLGCCYMNIKQYKKALPAFSESISIDNTQGQAWGNMSSCYMYLNKYKQAYSTLQQAVKYSERNWKLWANLLSVSLKLQKFYKYFECVQRIVGLDKSQILNFQILQKISIIFRHYKQSVARKHSISAMRNRINRLFQYLISKIGQNTIVWRAIYYFYVELENFIVENHHHYTKIHAEGKIKDYDNDILEGYEVLENIKVYTNQQLFDLYNSILDCKLTEVNMAMKVGWDTAKNMAEEVLPVIQEYIWVWNKYACKILKGEQKTKNKHNKNQHELFIEGIRKKLQKCLQRPIEYSPKEL